MNYNIIATGSGGNAILFEDGTLVDCGIPWDKLKSYQNDIKRILLTHKHADHFKQATIKNLTKRKPLVRIACCGYMAELLKDVPSRQVDVLDYNDTIEYEDGLKAKPFELFHDVPNCGWEITFSSGFTAMYATDTATMGDYKAKGRNLYLLEGNHDLDQAQATIRAKEARGEFAYEKRAIANHLSHKQALEWLAENMDNHSTFQLIHGHQNKEG